MRLHSIVARHGLSSRVTRGITDLDTPDKVPEPGLEAAVRAFAKIIDEVNTVELKNLKTPRVSDNR